MAKKEFCPPWQAHQEVAQKSRVDFFLCTLTHAYARVHIGDKLPSFAPNQIRHPCAGSSTASRSEIHRVVKCGGGLGICRCVLFFGDMSFCVNTYHCMNAEQRSEMCGTGR